jgi:hypothetical protein
MLIAARDSECAVVSIPVASRMLMITLMQSTATSSESRPQARVIMVTTKGFQARQTLQKKIIISQFRIQVDAKCDKTNRVSVSGTEVFSTTQLVTRTATARKRKDYEQEEEE